LPDMGHDGAPGGESSGATQIHDMIGSGGMAFPDAFPDRERVRPRDGAGRWGG
jgi:hypothetical protein